MSKEDQKAASDRIMEKLGAFSPEEQVTYARLTTLPEDYPSGDRDKRKCQECGKKFQTIPQTKEREEVTAFQQFVDHQTKHNPSPALWAEAHKRIQQGREMAKATGSQPTS